MNRNTDGPTVFLRHHRATALVAVVFVMGTFALTSCGVVNAVRKVEHDVKGNRATIDHFTSTIKSTQGATFEATYETTGSAPATIVYAVEPPQGLAFQDTPSGASAPNVDLIVNSSGEYSCSPPASVSSTSRTCQKLGTADAAAQNQIFLKGFSIAAGLAGDKVTSSTKSVNGFNMQCVDFNASGVPGTSTICSTSQGILGYVNVAGDSTSFEIKSYSSTPSSSLFELPPGATITTTPTTTS